MKDIVISVTAKTSEVKPSTTILGVAGEHLQSQVIVEFADEFIDGTATFNYMTKSGKKGSLVLTKGNNVYTAGVTEDLTAETPTVKCQVKIVQATTAQGTPIFKSRVFDMTVCNCIDE